MSKKDYPLIFIVEDNIAYSKIVEHHLKTKGFETIFTFISGEECLQYLYLKPDIVIQDYKLQGMSGLNVLQEFKRKLPECEFIFLSGQEDIEIAINTVKLGAFDYIVKNETAMERLVNKIDIVIGIQQLKRRNKNYRKVVFAFIIAVLFLLILLIMSSGIYLF